MSVTESSTSNVGSSWDRIAVAYQNAARLPTNVVSYGPGVGTDEEFKLIGSVEGKRVLDLGCGGGQNSIAFARQGAISIGVDASVQQLAFARRLVEQEENIRAEFRHGDFSQLAFQRADSIDLVFSAFAFQYAPDIARVFRQVHRVLKLNSMFLMSVPHPMLAITNRPSTRSDYSQRINLEPETITRSYFSDEPIETFVNETPFAEYHRTTTQLVTTMMRTGFRIEALLEPQGKTTNELPVALIIRARKES